MAVSFILCSDNYRFKKLNEDLKSATNRGRDEYPVTLTEDFDLLVRESGEYDSMTTYNPRHRSRSGRGGRGRNSFLFA